MSLKEYTKKRNFGKTPEPAGRKSVGQAKLEFVVQRHKATSLHYDFRLELDGVLKSWAVPHGPSMNPDDKRLALMVEDHPYDYRKFKGVIPEGNYGAGIVEIWDKGYYTCTGEQKDVEKKLRAGLYSGNLKFFLKGKKLKGEFVLVKIKDQGEKDNAWLLIKHRDEYAVTTAYEAERITDADSPINKYLKEKIKNTQHKKKGGAVPQPEKPMAGLIKPMLAKETGEPFDDKDWIFEIKWDGYRALAQIIHGTVQLYSRYNNLFNNSYPEIVKELSKIKANVVIDGEIVLLNEDGKPDFQKLQNYKNNQEYPVYYYVFDLLSLEGRTTFGDPLIKRKNKLKKILVKSDLVRYTDHIEETGVAFFDTIAKFDLEGIIAKKKDSGYYPGKRSSEWLKIKTHTTKDAIICGFTRPEGSRQYFGSLVLGLEENGHLEYIGNVGTGFNEHLLKEISAKLTPVITEKSPFSYPVRTKTPVTWVEPLFICEVRYSEMTSEHRLRHPVFITIKEERYAANDGKKKTRR